MIGVAAFAATETGIRALELVPALPVRAASVIKPLLAWVAGDMAIAVRDDHAWRALSARAVTISDNAATAELWARYGAEELLASLNRRIGTDWMIDGDGEHPALRIMVTAGGLARAFAALASDRTDVGREVRQWMRDVPPEQTFGVRRVAGDALGVAACEVGVKCGWFGGERAHAVVLVETASGTVGSAVITSTAPDEATRASLHAAIGDDMKLAAVHDALAGAQIRAATRRALLETSKLRP
ncbi:MAG TPA: serine hydrolase [Acidimicrobiales bacterium]|nr:serine hydrolase [Acidimicrobiales bacterium]